MNKNIKELVEEKKLLEVKITTLLNNFLRENELNDVDVEIRKKYFTSNVMFSPLQLNIKIKIKL